MPLDAAPFYTDIRPGPDTGAAFWAEAPDGVRIRLGVWPLEGARGTVLLFPGRTEYIEKYGVTAGELASRGFATMAIDWRGQGLADRFLDNPLIGHIDHFPDYQKDVAAMTRAAREAGLPRPYFLLAHSMGGCIGLRAVMEGLPVQAAAFTGPMWGIQIAQHMKFPAWALSNLLPKIGQGHRIPPGTKPEPYVLVEPFEDNMLTTDRAMYDMMKDQLKAHPELALAAPSFTWLREGLRETEHLASRTAPTVPCVSYLGSNERIVRTDSIHERMEKWKGGRLEMIEGGEHEVLMETPALRTRVLDDMAELFQSALNA